MKRKTVLLVSLIAVLLLAGLCACKQEVTSEDPTPEKPTVDEVSIPKWYKNDDGLQNLPDIGTSGTETGVTEALVNGLKNPPTFTSAKNLIVLVCEGLTSELIESSASQYGELILNSLPVKSNTSSKFTDAEGKTLAELIMKDLSKNQTGITAWGELSTNSMRRMTTTDDNEATKAQVSYDQFLAKFVLTLGKGDYSEVDANVDKLNDVFKAGGVIVSTLEEAIPAYENDEYHFKYVNHEDYGPVVKLYTIFKNDTTLPTFRQEMAFSLAWMQSKQHSKNGFCLLSSYSPSSALDAAGVQDFDEGVAMAVKFVLENPDTALLICGCPVNGSVADVCFYGLGKGVSAQSTLYECVSSLYSE